MALDTTNPLTPWLQRLLPRIQGATETEITEELKYTIHDFCREGEPWQEVVGPYNVVANDPQVSINPVDGNAQAIYVKAVWLNDSMLTQLPYNAPRPYTDSPTSFTCESDPTVVTLVPVPTTSSEQSLKAHVVLCPKCPDKWMPDWFESHYFEAIFDGVLGRFYSQLQKPFSDTRLAQYHLRRYRNRCIEARDMARRGHTPHAAKWSFPAFGV